MVYVAVFENEDFSLSRALLPHSDCAIITNPSGFKTDVALISNTFSQKIFPIKSDIAIVPDSLDKDILSLISAKNVISYGLCTKNTVTASSLIGSKLGISLQRKIPDVYGRILDEQELFVDIDSGMRAEDALGIVSALLTLGTSPYDISKKFISS